MRPWSQHTAHDELHDQLDCLAARLAQVVDVWLVAQLARVDGQRIEKVGAPRLVDETGGRFLDAGGGTGLLFMLCRAAALIGGLVFRSATGYRPLTITEMHW